MSEGFSYKKAGVDISTADAAKREMAKSLETSSPRVLNRLGAFASLYDGRFDGYEHPVLVLKMEEPGSKQKLAVQHGRVGSVCFDLVNHLIDDVIVMGAKPLAVQDVIICGKLEKPVVTEMVDAMARACREQDCDLVGGETSEQPGVLESGLYVLAAAMVGVVDKPKIIDGSKIRKGDVVLGVASNGLHTNGYSLVRALLAGDPKLADTPVDGERFIDAILRPHTCYYKAFRGLFDNPALHGMAHITGGGIEGNLNRVLPADTGAVIDAAKIQILPVFKVIRQAGQVDDADMLRTFNLGVGMTLVVAADAVEAVVKHLANQGHKSYPIGRVTDGDRTVNYENRLTW
jgi:phosphoribosylformylglycinamidine cyclo-ligase